MKIYTSLILLMLVAACCSMPAMGAATKYLGASPQMSAYMIGVNEFSPGSDATITLKVQNGGVNSLVFLNATVLPPDDLPALRHPVNLIRCLYGSSRNARNHWRESILCDVEHVLTKWAGRLKGPVTCSLDHPSTGKDSVPLSSSFFENIGHQCAHSTCIGWIVHPTRSWYRIFLSHHRVREEPSIDRSKGNGVQIGAILFEKKVWVRKHLGLCYSDFRVLPLCRIIQAQCLILRDGTTADKL